MLIALHPCWHEIQAMILGIWTCVFFLSCQEEEVAPQKKLSNLFENHTAVSGGPAHLPVYKSRLRVYRAPLGVFLVRFACCLSMNGFGIHLPLGAGLLAAAGNEQRVLGQTAVTGDTDESGIFPPPSFQA